MHPILIYIFDNFYIGTYGALVAFGALVGALLALYRAKRAGIPTDFIIDLLFYSTLVGFIGGRLFFIFVNFKDFLLHPAQYIFSRQGFVFLGGIVCALPVAVYYTRRKKMPTGKVADVLAPSLPLAHIFGRLGCFAAGCCYGKVCISAQDLFCKLALSFPAVYDKKGELIGSFVYIDHLQRGLIKPTDLHSLPVIPTQLLEAGANFIIFFSLLW
ncbi:MAG: prolipoprotein diacylglyceryl transferase, partial [Candidatus Sumerlaeia bacterium]|nr:prolipoprotein diacylglyceryl transferase [Candidatus Sumerlaeia bacterium]